MNDEALRFTSASPFPLCAFPSHPFFYRLYHNTQFLTAL